jgi:hypothetical protein
VDHVVGDDNDAPLLTIICDGAQCIYVDGYNNVMPSNCRENGYGEKDSNGVMWYRVGIMLNDSPEGMFYSIANIMTMGTSLDRAMLDDDIRSGYREGIGGEGVILVDGEHMPNIRDGNDNIPIYGYGSMDDTMDYTRFDESSVISNEGNDERIGGDVMTNTNAVGSSIGQDTDDDVSMTMRDDTAYTHTSDMIHDTFGDHEEEKIGQGNNVRSDSCNKGCYSDGFDSVSRDGDKSTTDLSRETSGDKITCTVGSEVNYVER